MLAASVDQPALSPFENPPIRAHLEEQSKVEVIISLCVLVYVCVRERKRGRGEKANTRNH